MSRPKIISPDTQRGSARNRTPPPPVLTQKCPVPHYGSAPKADPHAPPWPLKIFGQVEDPHELPSQQIRAPPAIDVFCDMHCVTHWSRLDNTFTGVPTKTLIDRAKPKPTAKYV